MRKIELLSIRIVIARFQNSYERSPGGFTVIDRRIFLKYLIMTKFLISNFFINATKTHASTPEAIAKGNAPSFADQKNHLGVSSDGLSKVYKVVGGSAEDNMRAFLAEFGGIEKLIGKNDIVVLKVNAQWTMQGMTNTDSMKAFMEVVLGIEDFDGEIIIAENHQHKKYDYRGWSTDKPNGRYNYNELIKLFNAKGHKNVTSYHWRCAGPNPEPLEGDDDGTDGKRVSGPSDGDGYVWRDDIAYVSPEGKRCLMTYPVFTSKYSGITIDLKNGPWKDGQYLTDRAVKFINFSALNFHSLYCGVTASVKNLMGVVDMSCGFQSPTPENTYNTHFIGVKKYIKMVPKIPTRYLKRLRRYLDEKAYENFHYTGGALGKFMRDIRFPDLNIITAHWVGWGSRWKVEKSSYPKALLAGVDPVALDYVAAKDILLKETPLDDAGLQRLNNPDNVTEPYYKFLKECNMQGIGNLSENKIKRIEISL